MTRQRRRQRQEQSTSSIDLIGEYLLQNILSRLPALSFASAACVSRSWNSLCNLLLSRPKLSSAFSLNPSLRDAVKEVVNEVLSEPLRPHFAIACISPSFSLRLAHKLITEKLGSTTPVVTYESRGIIGRDALTNEFKEVQWDLTVQDDPGAQVDNLSPSPVVTHGILLTVGFLPGLKVDAIPLLQSIECPQVLMVDQFVMDIREYTASVSGCTSPAGIIMFGGSTTDMKPVLDKMDCAMSLETVIVGDENGRFLHKRPGDTGNATRNRNNSSVGVALTFVRDRNKPHAGIGDIEFHCVLSTGMLPIGPTFKAVAVRESREECSTWLTARREELHDILDGETMINDINHELGDRIEYPFFYIGVTKRRKCSVGLEKVKWVTSLVFHEVTGGDEEYLFVSNNGIKTGDTFRFYYPDPSSASSSSSKVSEKFRLLKQDWDHRSQNVRGGNNDVFGGMIFACCGRGEAFFGCPNVDSAPFLENFAGVPLAGMFSCGEIGRGSKSLYDEEEAQEQSPIRCCLHAYSSVYLVMSYTLSQPEH
ncbi:hypothetical protein CsSME_00007153 [Camellia sinensis var. sinensis]